MINALWAKKSLQTMCAGDMFNYMAQKPGPLCKMFVVQTVELAKIMEKLIPQGEPNERKKLLRFANII